MIKATDSGSDARHGYEPPRLVLRFALLTAVLLAAAAGAILLIVRHVNTAQAERGATLQARFVADSFLRSALRPADFRRPVAGSRRAELDRLFRRHVLRDGIVLATLFSGKSTITYSNDHALIGRPAKNERNLRESQRGTIRSDVSSTEAEGARGPDTKVLRTYVPIPFTRGKPGVVALFQDYGPIASAADAAFFPVAGVFEVILLALYVALVPILARVARRLRTQMQQIEYQAFFDDLTGLPNRTLFRDRAGQAILAARRSGHEAAVFLIDLDRFKEVNDTLGHHAGDMLLRDLSSRLRGVVREHETLARLGGDEFAVLLPRTSRVAATRVAERILRSLRQPFVLRGIPLEVEASVGAALYPDHGTDVETLMQRADVAMYGAKEARSGYALYDAQADPNDPLRLALIGELRRAMDQAELLLHYQPKVDLRSGEIVGAEALLRWQHPEHGLLPPGEFVPLAERTGLIRPLSRYVLASALRECAEWRAEGLDLRIAVNCTMPDLFDPALADNIEHLLAEYELDPSRLELEITESTIMADPFHLRKVLAQLRETGVLVAIDDFGTGYSSLGYLKHLPVDQIKVDKSFVLTMATEESDATIVRSTIELARNLGLGLVAEGVETQEICRALSRLGCPLAQGNYLSPPLDASQFRELLRGWSGRAEVLRSAHAPGPRADRAAARFY